jgi:two-component system, cell cycle response regulator
MMILAREAATTLADTPRSCPQPPRSALNRQACLVMIYPTGPGAGTRHLLDRRTVLLGRAEDCDIPIRDCTTSRKHCRVEHHNDAYQVVDLGSTNGTYVNDARVLESSPLKDGDYVRVGNHIYRFLAGGNIEADYHQELYRLTIFDALTGIHNRRFLLNFLDREVTRSVRHGRCLALLLIDVDRFGAINAELGHLGGDVILRELAQRLGENVNDGDLVARYGGEEFIVTAVETSPAAAERLAERLRRQVENAPFGYDGVACRVTISLGVATITGQEKMTVTELIHLADQRLYRAKQQGRNQVVVGSDPTQLTTSSSTVLG